MEIQEHPWDHKSKSWPIASAAQPLYNLHNLSKKLPKLSGSANSTGASQS